MQIPYVVCLIGACLTAGFLIAMFSKTGLVQRSNRWGQLIVLVLAVGMAVGGVAFAPDHLKMFLYVGLPVLVALIVRSPALLVWYPLSWRADDRWRAKDGQRVIDYFTKRGWPVDLRSDIYAEPSAGNDGHGLYKVILSFVMKEDDSESDCYGRLWYMVSYEEWAKLMFMLSVTYRGTPKQCADHGCDFTLRTEREQRAFGLSITQELRHNHDD